MPKWNFLPKQRTETCPDGRKVSVYKDPNDAFPVFVPEYSASLHGQIDPTLVQAQSMEARFKKRVSSVLEILDKDSQDLIYKFRIVYTVYQASPCTKEDYLAAKVEQLIAKHDRLTKVRAATRLFLDTVSEVKDDPKVVGKMYHELLREICF